MILVLGAMPEEIAGVLEQVAVSQTRELIQQSIWSSGQPQRTQKVSYGNWCGQPVAVTTAGVGKVQAALTAGVLLERHRDQVTHLIFTGVAGGLRPDIAVGDIVVGSETMQHDVDATALNGIPGYDLVRGQIPFTQSPVVCADPELLGIARQFRVDDREVHVGRILSGDQFLNGALRARLGYFDELDGYAIEMEGAAVAVAASAYGVKNLVIRTISDRADDVGPENFAEFVASVAVHNSVQMLEHILKAL